MRIVAVTLLCAMLATPASAQQERAPDPPGRESALALVPQGDVAGEAYRREGALGCCG